MTIHARASKPKRSTPSEPRSGGIATTPTTMGNSWPARFQMVLRASRRPLVRFGIGWAVFISLDVAANFSRFCGGRESLFSAHIMALKVLLVFAADDLFQPWLVGLVPADSFRQTTIKIPSC